MGLQYGRFKREGLRGTLKMGDCFASVVDWFSKGLKVCFLDVLQVTG